LIILVIYNPKSSSSLGKAASGSKKKSQGIGLVVCDHPFLDAKAIDIIPCNPWGGSRMFGAEFVIQESEKQGYAPNSMWEEKDNDKVLADKLLKIEKLLETRSEQPVRKLDFSLNKLKPRRANSN